MHRPHQRRIPRPARLAALALICVACAREPEPVDTTMLAQDTQAPLSVTTNPRTGRPSFVRGRIPVQVLGIRPADTSRAVADAFLKRYARMLGTDSAGGDMRLVGARTDALGMRHFSLQQIYRNVDVYAGAVSVHLAREGGVIAAVTSNVVPNVRVSSTEPAITQDSARALAATQLLHGTTGTARLAIYPGRERASAAKLAWMVEVVGFRRDTAAPGDSLPARFEYVIDAARGNILDVLDRLFIARNRRTHDAGGGTTLPGTLRRSEGDPPTGDADVDAGHDFVGSTYDYYAATHGRDSYDGAGATLNTTVHYGVNYQNAFWNGAQMVFGDGFAVKDVTAHELTHAITERTANLEYRWQSGALNESFSDIFGAMVDRDDWLMGEDLPIGAIRNMENPGAFGDPAHTSAFVSTCADNEGVHTNSGISNKAFVNVATSIGKDDAERIFYRALVVYLGPQSTLEDARAAALQSAEDLFGAGSPQAQAVDGGFAAVGLNGSFQPAPNNCGGPTPGMSLTALILLALALLLAVLLRARPAMARA